MNLQYTHLVSTAQYYESLCMRVKSRANFLLSGTVRITDDARAMFVFLHENIVFLGGMGGSEHERAVAKCRMRGG